MKKILLFTILPFIGFGQTQIGSDIDGEAAGDQSGRSVSLSADGSTVAIGAYLMTEMEQIQVMCGCIKT